MRKIPSVLCAMFLIILAGCGGGGGGGGGSDDGSNSNNGNNSTVAGTQLSLLSEQVKLYIPYLDDDLAASVGSSLGEWSSWDPGNSGTVLGKLFNPENGKDECIHSVLQMLDSHIQMVNQFSGQWVTSGTYVHGNITATVDTSCTNVTIPFLNADFPGVIDRLVTLSVPDQNLTIRMAFAQDGLNQTIVEQYTIGYSESGVFLARNSGSRIQVWVSAVNDSNVQIMLECSTSEGWFKITEASNASGGNWEVIGGGSISGPSSQMAFMARNNANNSSNDEYYLTISLEDLENGSDQTVMNAQSTPPSSSTNDVLAYISGENFFIDPKYPVSLDELAWVQ